jgi:hypothetical protein
MKKIYEMAKKGLYIATAALSLTMMNCEGGLDSKYVFHNLDAANGRDAIVYDYKNSDRVTYVGDINEEGMMEGSVRIFEFDGKKRAETFQEHRIQDDQYLMSILENDSEITEISSAVQDSIEARLK